ncbi:MAG: hypothetical protein IPO08_05770 [Xanthomonadales bacterium]|nr:hypothetical protein [Xanthomonadales bacterium]
MRSVFRFVLYCLLISPGFLFAASKRFEVDYHVGFLPAEGLATVRIEVRPDSGRVVSLDLRMDAERYLDVQGDGEIVRAGERVAWTVPDDGGELRYRYRIDKRRRDGGFDARITPDWTLVRLDHLVPPLRARLTRDTDARARLFVDLPAGWSNVDTQYLRSRDGASFVIVDPRQRFDRPTGWLIAGDVGTRREQIHGMEVSVGAPKGDPMGRNEYIAFINIVAPEMLAAFDSLPKKMLIVGAGDPMWRGGLSGPRSLYLHSERPILSENGTSTLIHELVHVVTRVRGEVGDDWIAEGLAEFYSIELMRRSGLLTEARADKAFDWMRNHGKAIKTLHAERSFGPRTARAVTLFRALDAEIRQRTRDAQSLDDLVRALMALKRRIATTDLRGSVQTLTGQPSEVLQTSLLTE